MTEQLPRSAEVARTSLQIRWKSRWNRSLRSEATIRLGLRVVALGPVLMLAVVALAMAIATPLFVTDRNLTNLALQSGAIVALALGQLLVILTRGVDISVGSIIGLAGAMGATLYGAGAAGPLTVAGMVAAGAAVGFLNGLLFVKGRLPHPLIATLATYGIARGVGLLMTNGDIIAGQPDLVISIGQGMAGPVPVPAIIVAVLAVVVWVLTKKTRWGRWIYAIGGEPEAARRVGIPVGRVLISVYVFSGFAAGIAGVITSGRTGVGDASAGALSELDAIAAVMIGGASFLGGRGGASNAVVGALTVATIRNGLNLQGVTAFWELVAIGTIIVLAVELNVVRTHFEERFRTLQAAARDHGAEADAIGP